MKHPLQILLLLFTCTAKFGSAQVQSSYGSKTAYSKEVLQKIKSVEQNLSGWAYQEGSPKWTIEERMKQNNVKGVSIAVIKDYQIEWVKAYGKADDGEQRDVTTETRFQAGSISKSLNAVGLLTLVKSGKVDLYRDINDYLVSWKFPYDSIAKGKTISLANLLSHTAGLSVHGFPGYSVTDSVPSLPQILDGTKPANTAAVRSLFEPGVKFKYSGGGTTISQLLLMDVTHQPYDQYMWEHVLKPMGMMNSTYTQPLQPKNPALYAAAYYEDGKEVKGKYHLYPEQGAAGLWTTPGDIAKYIIETQLALAGKSSKVLNQELTRLRLTPYVDGEAALGVFIMEKAGKKYFSHNGQDEGFTAGYLGSFDGNGVVVMSNSNSSTLNSELVNSVATVYGWEGLMPETRKVIELADTAYNKFVGTYKVVNDTLMISKEEMGLIMRVKGTPIRWKIYFTSPTEFFLMDLKGDFMVEQSFAEKVNAITLKQGNNKTPIKRIE